jgi:hypothetical protein
MSFGGDGLSYKLSLRIHANVINEMHAAPGSGPGQPLVSTPSCRLQPSMAQAQSPCPIQRARGGAQELFSIMETTKDKGVSHPRLYDDRRLGVSWMRAGNTQMERELTADFLICRQPTGPAKSGGSER